MPASTTSNSNGSSLVVMSDSGGVTVIDQGTPLKRLNYFDGKFLRADDFDVEQRYLRQLVAVSNQGLGPGVVYGYDTTQIDGDTIQIGPGLAMDPSGTVMLLSSTIKQSISDLIAKSAPAGVTTPDASGKSGPGTFADCIEIPTTQTPPAVTAVGNVYVIAICPAEAKCGQADVYGKLCEDACITTTDKKYRLDGVVLRAIPLSLVTPYPASTAVDINGDKYLRSKIAHSWFADEVLRHPDSLSRPGLRSETWCLGAGYTSNCCEVPLALVARTGSTTVFLDAWTVRRERMEAPPQRYWQWKMRMRPMDVFLAQILQFQCQLEDVLSKQMAPAFSGKLMYSIQAQMISSPGSATDAAVAAVAGAVAGAAGSVAAAGSGGPMTPYKPTWTAMPKPSGWTKIEPSSPSLTPYEPAKPVGGGGGTSRTLIKGGIIELPPAGYLPVDLDSGVNVNDQVRALLGEGLDLRFCIASADFIAHKVEEAQHMDRISLLQGLDDPSNKPHVDVFVPDGRAGTAPPAADLYDATARFSAKPIGTLVARGAAREAALPSGGSALYVAGVGLAHGGVIRNFQQFAKTQSQPDGKKQKPKTEWEPDLSSNRFARETRLSDAAFYTRAGQESTSARAFMYSYAAGGAKAVAPAGRGVAARHESLDGLWLTAQSAQPIATLQGGDETAVSLRAVIAARPEAPDAFEITFHGTLSISHIVQALRGRKQVGTLSGIYSFGVLQEDQAHERTTEFLITERGQWPATVLSSEFDGLIALEVAMPISRYSAVRFTRTALSESEVDYLVEFLTEPGARLGHRVASLDLMRDAGAASATNRAHVLAENGLDLVQTALIVSEPDLKARADAQLFPPIDETTAELTIDPVRDWVMFMKRREKQCSARIAPVAAPELRRYRVLNLTSKTFDEAAIAVRILEGAMKAFDRTRIADWINKLLDNQEQAQPAVLTYEDDSTTPQTDLDMDAWKAMNPGGTIRYAAIGAAGEDDNQLQSDRLSAVESLVGGRDEDTVEKVMVPYPDDAVPADADGIIVFITVAEDVPYGVTILGTIDEGGTFVPRQAIPYRGQVMERPTTDVENTLVEAGRPIRELAVYTKVKADDTVKARLGLLQKSLGETVEMGAKVKPQVEKMTAQIRGYLTAQGVDPDKVDHVTIIGH